MLYNNPQRFHKILHTNILGECSNFEVQCRVDKSIDMLKLKISAICLIYGRRFSDVGQIGYWKNVEDTFRIIDIIITIIGVSSQNYLFLNQIRQFRDRKEIWRTRESNLVCTINYTSHSFAVLVKEDMQSRPPKQQEETYVNLPIYQPTKTNIQKWQILLALTSFKSEAQKTFSPK